MNTDLLIRGKSAIVRAFACLLLCMMHIAAKAATPIAIFYSGTKTLSFAVVADAEAEQLLSQYAGYAWAGEEAMHTHQMKAAPWKDCKASIEKVVFTSSFSAARPQTMYAWFSGCTSLTTVEGLQYLNTSETYEMRYLFNGCTSLKEMDLSMLNTASVKYMGSMFSGCTSLTSVNFGTINTSSVVEMEYMFKGASMLETVDLSRLNMSSVTSISRMFSDCSALTTVEFPNITSSAMTDLSYLFYKCTKLEYVDVTKLNTSNVTKMDYMFEFCS